MNIAVMSIETFFRHQKLILFPAIERVWREEQQWLIASLQSEKRVLVLGNDGRADSPGHSAKYGTYTGIELQSHVVLDVQLVQVIIYHVLHLTINVD